MTDKATLKQHWAKSSRLLYTVLGIWFFFAYFLHFFVTALNEISFLGFPLGYYMAAQGSLFSFVVLIFWFAKKQNTIDESFGLAEKDEGGN